MARIHKPTQILVAISSAIKRIVFRAFKANITIVLQFSSMGVHVPQLFRNKQSLRVLALFLRLANTLY